MPKPLDQDWIRELKTYANKFLTNKEFNSKDINVLSEFLDLALNLAKTNPEDSPIRYAVKILSKKLYKDNDVFAFVIMSLSRLCFIFPYFIDVFNILLQKNTPNDEILALVEKEINSIAKEHKVFSI